MIKSIYPHSCQAFTLIELLIVVAIIAILAAIAVPNFLEAQTRAKVSRSINDLRTMATAMETYHIDSNKYAFPTSIGIGLPAAFPRDREIQQMVNGTATYPYGAFSYELTTPIAYCTTLAEDVFKLAGFGVLVGSSISVPRGHPWRRMTLGTAASGCTPFFSDVRRPDFYNKKWIAVSLGPDRAEDIFSPFTMMEYDATNGTISRGDISRSGP